MAPPRLPNLLSSSSSSSLSSLSLSSSTYEEKPKKPFDKANIDFLSVGWGAAERIIEPIKEKNLFVGNRILKKRLKDPIRAYRLKKGEDAEHVQVQVKPELTQDEAKIQRAQSLRASLPEKLRSLSLPEQRKAAEQDLNAALNVLSSMFSWTEEEIKKSFDKWAKKEGNMDKLMSIASEYNFVSSNKALKGNYTRVWLACKAAKQLVVSGGSRQASENFKLSIANLPQKNVSHWVECYAMMHQAFYRSPQFEAYFDTWCEKNNKKNSKKDNKKNSKKDNKKISEKATLSSDFFLKLKNTAIRVTTLTYLKRSMEEKDVEQANAMDASRELKAQQKRIARLDAGRSKKRKEPATSAVSEGRECKVPVGKRLDTKISSSSNRMQPIKMEGGGQPEEGKQEQADLDEEVVSILSFPTQSRAPLIYRNLESDMQRRKVGRLSSSSSSSALALSALSVELSLSPTPDNDFETVELGWTPPTLFASSFSSITSISSSSSSLSSSSSSSSSVRRVPISVAIPNALGSYSASDGDDGASDSLSPVSSRKQRK